MRFALADWLVTVAFFVVLLAIPAFANRRRARTSSDFFQSGRSMPWWLIGISMVAAMTSTNSANLFTQLIRENGLAGNWVWWSFLTGGVLTVFVYAKLWHRSGATTDIAFYELRYSGKPAAFLRAFRAVYLGVIYNVIVMATVLLGAVKLGAVLFGVPVWTILAVTAVASIAYSMIGGIRGTIYADFYLFTLIMIGAVAVTAFALSQPEVGGWAALMQNAAIRPKLDFLPRFDDLDTAIAVFIVPVAIQWWNVWYSGSEPGGGGYIVQRMLTAKTPNHALGGTLFAQIVQYALRPWPWYITAFASILVFPDLASIRAAFPDVDPALVGNDMAYPAMIKFVPAGWLGLVAASLMGALFSTIAAHLSMGANYVANDVWVRFVRPQADGRELIRVARWTSVGLMLAGCLLVP
ncbi:MAG TPA: Na+:solute symporter, partial [Kiritimatiellia bacterium]|nr:Na+:solute symporter [Kiritimatiellia bacterium]